MVYWGNYSPTTTLLPPPPPPPPLLLLLLLLLRLVTHLTVFRPNSRTEDLSPESIEN